MPSSPATEQEQAETQASEHAAPSPREAELEDKWKRALADLDNFRKRSSRLTEERLAEAHDRQLLEWLEVVDSVERALQMSPSAFGDLRAVLDQIDVILQRDGVKRIGEVGERFDPRRHEAIATMNSEELEPGVVAALIRSGYARDDRVLRPARVAVTTTAGSDDAG